MAHLQYNNWNAGFLSHSIPDFTVALVPHPFCLTILLIHLGISYTLNFFLTFFKQASHTFLRAHT